MFEEGEQLEQYQFTFQLYGFITYRGIDMAVHAIQNWPHVIDSQILRVTKAIPKEVCIPMPSNSYINYI